MLLSCFVTLEIRDMQQGMLSAEVLRKLSVHPDRANISKCQID